MHSLMENPPLRRQPVLLPLLLDMDQPPLPFAKLKVLQTRNRQKVVLGEQNIRRMHSRRAPSGSS